MSNSYVPRRLSWVDDQQHARSIGDIELASQSAPVVVLSEPGGGKSELFRYVSKKSDAPLVTASKWLRSAYPETLIKADLPIFIDALDEASARRDGDAIQKVLERLDAAGAPRFVISCRAADWEARAATGIGQDYGVRPIVCHLEPFTRTEAAWLLGRLCPDNDPAVLISELESKGLAPLLASPLSIELVSKVVLAHGDLPGSRAALFDAAVNALWSEHDADRATDPLATLTATEALDAAGATCAALLMSGRDAVATTGPGQTGQDAISIYEINKLPGAGHARTVIGSKLFKVEELPGKLVPIHRTVAEYLGARWLATTTGKRARSRLLARLQPASSVPARLRGLHAWLAHFDGELGRKAIACDPFGVIRYGDVDALSLDAARHLLSSLVALAGLDPYFRAGDWERYSLETIMRAELAPDVDALISASETNHHLRSLLIEGIRGTPLARQLWPTLDAIARGRHRFYRERDDALKAMEDWQTREWSLAMMEELRGQATEDATRLAVGLLSRIGPGVAGPEATAAVLLANIGLTVCAVPRESVGAHVLRSYHKVVDAVPDAQVGPLLDLLGDHATLLLQRDDWQSGNDIADVIARLALRLLPDLPAAEAPRAWKWLAPLGRAYAYHRDPMKELEAVMIARTDLRQAVQRHVAFELRLGDDLGMTIYAHLGRAVGLALSYDDLIAFLNLLAEADRGDGRLREDWRELTTMLRGQGTFPEELVPNALAFVNDDPELIQHLQMLRHPQLPRVPSHWELQRTARIEKFEIERDARFAEHRAKYVRNRERLRAGNPEEINPVGEAYIRDHQDLREDTALRRLETWLGPDLLPDALSGLEAVLHRDDLPDLAEVSASRAEGRDWYIGYAILAGILERLRRGEDLENIPRRALLIANLHSIWCGNVGGDGGEAARATLEEMVCDTPEHFDEWHRLRIEPQLQHRNSQIDGLYDLTHDPRYPERAHLLLREWLIVNIDLPHEIESEMIDALIRARDYQTVREVSRRHRVAALPHFSALLFWLAVDWITDFEQCRANLSGIGAIAPDFLTSLQRRLGLDRHHSVRPTLSIAQLEWLVSEFRSPWPLVGRFGGEAEEWGIDGAELLRSFIDTLAGDADREAGAVLDRLAGAQRDSYTDTLLHAAAEQRQLRSETEFRPIWPIELSDLLTDGPPSDIDELRALVLDELNLAQEKLRGSDTDRVVEFWTDSGRPRDENRCRDRLVDLIEPTLNLYGIQRIPERDMPQKKRADLAFARGTMQLPMEIKGQWHSEVWDAASNQLDRLYLRDWRAEDRGIYVVLWFGDLPSKSGRRLKPHPSGTAPVTPQEMEKMLYERLPAARLGSIAIKVLDLTTN